VRLVKRFHVASQQPTLRLALLWSSVIAAVAAGTALIEPQPQPMPATSLTTVETMETVETVETVGTGQTVTHYQRAWSSCR
jgi:hypothetical protein